MPDNNVWATRRDDTSHEVAATTWLDKWQFCLCFRLKPSSRIEPLEAEYIVNSTNTFKTDNYTHTVVNSVHILCCRWKLNGNCSGNTVSGDSLAARLSCMQNGKVSNVLQQQPPLVFSSGSESSGYFTPPAVEHRRQPQKNPADFIRPPKSSSSPSTLSADNLMESSMDSTNCHQHPPIQPKTLNSSSEESSNENYASINHRNVNAGIQKSSPSLQLRCETNVIIRGGDLANTDRQKKSKSEMNLKTICTTSSILLPEIGGFRKNINSAPPLNDSLECCTNQQGSCSRSGSRRNLAAPFRDTEQAISSTVRLPNAGDLESTAGCRKKAESTTLARRLSNRRSSNRQKRSATLSHSIHDKANSNNNNNANNDESSLIARPKEALSAAIAQIEGNTNDWETVIRGLSTMIRLCHLHPTVLLVDGDVHQMALALSRSIRNLRSQVARTACTLAGELFAASAASAVTAPAGRRAIELELDELVPPLLQRTADTNKFLRGDANAALDALTQHLSVGRVVAVLAAKGATHQNGVVRATTTRLMAELAARLGPARVFQLGRETRDRFLAVAANGLTEGSLEARQWAKQLMHTLGQHAGFHRALNDAVSPQTLRHISKSLNALNRVG